METTWLAIESSRKAASLCLSVGEKQYESQLSGQRPQSSSLLATVNELLNQAEVEAQTVTDLAIHVGPGGATGLRMAIALAQAWSMVHPQLRLHAVPLEAIALEALNKSHSDLDRAHLIADAFGGQLFLQSFHKIHKKWVQQGHIQLLEADEALKPLEEPALIFHDLGRLRHKLDWPKLWHWAEDDFLQAQFVLKAASSGRHQIKIADCDVRYLKPSSAEILWRQKQKPNDS